MARRRRRRRPHTARNLLAVGTVVVLGSWWAMGIFDKDNGLDSTLALAPSPKAALTTGRPEIVSATPQQRDVSEKGSNSPTTSRSDENVDASAQRVKSLIKAGKQSTKDGDPVSARAYYSEAVVLGADVTDGLFLRAELTRIGTETIFSPRLFENDPHVTRYLIKTGDTLAKIAAENKISSDLLAEINGIANKNLIRAGQAIKVIKGPFRSVINRKAFTLDVYLGSTFVRHYRVGLGADGSTPAGEWQVSTKLRNPTYYPPRGGKIIAADDPQNPLGERWIGLQGVSGEAIGQLRYGIHGTIEAESIGKNASLGCVRMYNEDVEALYSYLVEKHSTVTID